MQLPSAAAGPRAVLLTAPGDDGIRGRGLHGRPDPGRACTRLSRRATRLSAAEAKAPARPGQPRTELTADLMARVVRAGERTKALLMPESSGRVLVDGTWDTASVLLAKRASSEEVAGRHPP